MIDSQQQKGIVFSIVKYLVIGFWILHIIGILLLLVFGSLMVSAAQVDHDNHHELFKEDVLEHGKDTYRFVGYTVMVVAIISLPIAILGIHGAYKESLKLNTIMCAIGIIGLVLTLFSGQIYRILLNVSFTCLIIYYTYLIKKFQDMSIKQVDNNPEFGGQMMVTGGVIGGGVGEPNEKTGIAMYPYKQ
ncbi:uncharacterized protein LOC128953912 [Oppia nitens]|uniref:uncharacterized protein LOC128953912 n=1 Tax=Oppia nitens TaxID=1686743 RepID=UPI0023DB8372|nr:uncharacterized protein LOC128953912 [Oppia nitens]XP_054155423.1 uncharacterized protein LOC128953912 [Oppia nitens]